MHVCIRYRGNWLSAYAYNTWQQENMRLTKRMRLTGSMRLMLKHGRWGVRKLLFITIGITLHQ